jgi:hypothetical protein
MSNERSTIRPVTLARLVEATYLCGNSIKTTNDIEADLNITYRRARSVLLETQRIGFVEEVQDDGYTQTTTGKNFITTVQNENWTQVSSILATHSPHYRVFIDIIKRVDPVKLNKALQYLEAEAMSTAYTYNRTSVEVLGDWGERLGSVQRNAFTGEYYTSQSTTVPDDFDQIVLKLYHDLEETTGLGMRQRHLSIPRLREMLCMRIGVTRDAVDEALCELSKQNVGKIELSGAPIDTGAKDAAYGIKQLHLSDKEGLISTSHSTDRIMAGVEQFNKRYYYLTVHDENITYTQEADS